jgi:molybdopterin molybdotransferase
MDKTKHVVLTLSPLSFVLEYLLARCEPVLPLRVELSKSVGLISAENLAPTPYPLSAIATRDGWAMAAMDVVGASSYSPMLLGELPVWVEAGDALPQGSDCVLEPEMLERRGAIVQVVSEIPPGTGTRQIGDHAKQVGLEGLNVRQPRIKIINVPSRSGQSLTASFIEDAVRANGAKVSCDDARGRDVQAIVDALSADQCDLFLVVGGTGQGRTDATADALRKIDVLVAEGIALLPGSTTLVGMKGNCPIIALPGSLDQAVSIFLALVLPVLDRLSGYERHQSVRPLVQKIASAPGIGDVVLLRETAGGWLPLSTGDLPFHFITEADAWLIVPSDREGYAAGTPCGAFLFRDAV